MPLAEYGLILGHLVNIISASNVSRAYNCKAIIKLIDQIAEIRVLSSRKIFLLIMTTLRASACTYEGRRVLPKITELHNYTRDTSNVTQNY